MPATDDHPRAGHVPARRVVSPWSISTLPLRVLVLIVSTLSGRVQVSATALEVHHAVRKNGAVTAEVTVTNWRPGVECLVAIDGLRGLVTSSSITGPKAGGSRPLAGTAPGCGAAIALGYWWRFGVRLSRV